MSDKSYFIDTSALFKRYVKEQGSSIIASIFTEKANRYISQVTLIEVISNLRRLVEVDKLITMPDFEHLKETFLGDIGSDNLYTLDITSEVILEGIELCSECYLTPIDSIQLASALSIKACNPVFICADQKLIKVASDQNLLTLNPCDPEVNEYK